MGNSGQPPRLWHSSWALLNDQSEGAEEIAVEKVSVRECRGRKSETLEVCGMDVCSTRLSTDMLLSRTLRCNIRPWDLEEDNRTHQQYTCHTDLRQFSFFSPQNSEGLECLPPRDSACPFPWHLHCEGVNPQIVTNASPQPPPPTTHTPPVTPPPPPPPPPPHCFFSQTGVYSVVNMVHGNQSDSHCNWSGSQPSILLLKIYSENTQLPFTSKHALTHSTHTSHMHLFTVLHFVWLTVFVFQNQ